MKFDGNISKYIGEVAKTKFRVCTVTNHEMLYVVNALNMAIRDSLMLRIPAAFGYSAPRNWERDGSEFEWLMKNVQIGPTSFNNAQGSLPVWLVKDEVFVETATSPSVFISALRRLAVSGSSLDDFAFKHWFDANGRIRLKTDKKRTNVSLSQPEAGSIRKNRGSLSHRLRLQTLSQGNHTSSFSADRYSSNRNRRTIPPLLREDIPVLDPPEQRTDSVQSIYTVNRG